MDIFLFISRVLIVIALGLSARELVLIKEYTGAAILAGTMIWYHVKTIEGI